MIQTDVLKNGNMILQDSEGFMFGLDAVLLSHFAAGQVRRGDSVIDLGTGNGIIPLLMEKACAASSFTGLEIQEKQVELARRSLGLNGLEEKISIVQGDIKKVSELFAKHSFNVVVSNPPYMALDGRQAQNEKLEKSIARHELLCTLEDVVVAADYLLHSHGRFFMIHRPERLPEIFDCLLKHRLQPKRIQLIQPYADQAANLVLLEARKDARAGLKNLLPLVVRNNQGPQKGQYTKEINDIYSSLEKQAQS